MTEPSDSASESIAASDPPDLDATKRILIADDSKTSRHILESLLGKWGYQVTTCHDGAEALAALEAEGAPRLAVLDWTMPEIDGVEVCRRIRSSGQQHDYQYLILLTARSESEDLVEGLEAGADDYVSKPFDAEELRVRIRAGARIVELHARLERAQEVLRHQAMNDALTGALNRRAIRERLEIELSRAQREGQPVTVVIADADHFKQVNDTHGHQVGDEVLCELVRRWNRVLRGYDHLGRWGGEEFLFITPGAAGNPDESLYERLRSAICDQPFATSGGSVPVSASFGVATSVCDLSLEQWREQHEAVIEGLIGRADDALYQAKAKGRNLVEYAPA